MAGTLRTPPRFVPTLTAVVEEPPAFAVPAPAEALPAAVIGPAQQVGQVALSPLAEAEAVRLEEQLLHRVLQRIDLSLEERLTDAVSAAVQQQLDIMLPQLRGEIEQVLRALVLEAMAQELSQDAGSVPPPGPLAFG